MAGSLSPAFVKIEYHSLYAPHVMIIPTTQWTPPVPSIFDSGEFDQWDAGSIEADVMINELIDTFPPLFNDDVAFDGYTIYQQATPESVPVPVYAAALTQVGTNASAEWSQAVQRTLIWRNTAFKIVKLTFMDAQTDGTFGKIGNFSGISPFDAIHDVFTDPNNGWSGRVDGRPNQAIQMSLTLNEKLRRGYRLQ